MRDQILSPASRDHPHRRELAILIIVPEAFDRSSQKWLRDSGTRGESFHQLRQKTLSRIEKELDHAFVLAEGRQFLEGELPEVVTIPIACRKISTRDSPQGRYRFLVRSNRTPVQPILQGWKTGLKQLVIDQGCESVTPDLQQNETGILELVIVNRALHLDSPLRKRGEALFELRPPSSSEQPNLGGSPQPG